MNVISRLISCTVLASTLVVMIACGGGNSDSVASEPTEPLALSASLDRLGVETEPTPRLSSSGLPLPDDYAAFGERVKISINSDGESVLGAPRELVAVGFGLQDKTDFFSVADNLMLADCPVNNPFCLTDISTSEIYAKPVATAPWARETVNDKHETPQTLRDVTGADTDGDGYEEVVAVYYSQAQFVISIVNLQDPTQPERLEAIPLPANVALPGDIRVGAGNVDEDFPEEIVVAVTSIPSLGGRTQSSLIVLDVQAGSLDVIAVKEFSSTVDDTSQFSVLQIGNIDYDTRDEIVLILNESINNGSRYVHAAARFFIFDDGMAGFTQLLADNPSVTSADGTFVPQVIDAAIGDLNRDGVADILFGGVVALTEDQSCGQAQDSTGADVQVLHYTLAAYEYNGISINKTRVAYSTEVDFLYPAGCSESGAGENYIRFLDVNILDFDGDRDTEIQANQFIFDTLPAEGAPWTTTAEFNLGASVLFEQSFSNSAFHPGAGLFIVDDVTRDGRENILSYVSGRDSIDIYGWKQEEAPDDSPPLPPEYYRLGRIPVDDFEGVAVNPVLVVLDADSFNEGDVQTARFIGHEVEFTEPLVQAALAAPPCIEGIGQNTDACTTVWGQSESMGFESDHEISFTAGVAVGLDIEYDVGAGFVVDADTKVFGLTAKVQYSEELVITESVSYELTTSVSFESGPMEDSVVFVSIPYDVYSYEVIDTVHVTTDDLNAVSEIYRMAQPRTPVIRIAERGYYNANTPSSAVKIDSDVFGHTIGDLDSYPNVFERDEILDMRRSQIEDKRSACEGCFSLDPLLFEGAEDFPFGQFDPFPSLLGLKSQTVGVGQGGGSTEVSIDFSESLTSSEALSISAEAEVETTITGVLIGVAFGGGQSYSTSRTIGDSTLYIGNVGSISGENFAERRYRYGLFTYLQSDPDGSGQEFEVINYWVE